MFDQAETNGLFKAVLGRRQRCPDPIVTAYVFQMLRLACRDQMFLQRINKALPEALAAVTADVDATHSGSFERALQRWRRPDPRIALGEALVSLPIRVSCMDVSDGLAASFQQLSHITSVGFEMWPDRLPIAPEAFEIGAQLGIDPVSLACSASVEFELLITCSPEAAATVLCAAALAGTHLTEIGRCVSETALIARSSQGGHVMPLPGVPWDHQSTEIRSLFHAKG